MTDEANTGDVNPGGNGDETPAPEQVFLVVVDESEELSQALFYACRSAIRIDGRVGLLMVVEPAEFQHWANVAELMREERREEAEDMLQTIGTAVQQRTGKMPVIHIREGNVEEELIALIAEDQSIGCLVLGAATGDYGPGPLVSALVDKVSGKLRVPITVVPGALTQAEIAAIT